MKHNNTIIVVIAGLFVVILILLLKTNNSTIVYCRDTVASPPGQQDCNANDRMPTRVDSLNSKVLLNYNLSDNCNFQPIHIQVRESRSSEIIARFNAVPERDVYHLKQIEFLYFEIANNPNNVIINGADVKRNIDAKGREIIQIILKIKLGPEVSEIIKDKPDLIWEGYIRIKKGDIIDVKVEDDDGIYEEPPFSDLEINIPRGKQCSGTVG